MEISCTDLDAAKVILQGIKDIGGALLVAAGFAAFMYGTYRMLRDF